MFKNVADVLGDYDFDINDCKELNEEIGCEDFFRVSERGGGGIIGAEQIINIGVEIIAGLSVGFIMSVIKAVYNKVKQKSQSNQDCKEDEPCSITINCENYDCNNTYMSFTINMNNDDETIMNSIEKIKNIAKSISDEQ